jgi:exodeoxyribonuclease V gamma subunit
MADRGSGFCVFNDMAWAAKHFAGQGRRVLYVDLDAHHGDGVEALTRDEPLVTTCSVHDSTIFPGTGHDSEPDRRVHNFPLGRGAGDAELLASVGAVVQLADDWRPQVLLVAIGADDHVTDPLSSLRYSYEGYREAARALGALAARHRTPVLMGGAGGYQPLTHTPAVWRRSWLSCTSATGRTSPARGLTAEGHDRVTTWRDAVAPAPSAWRRCVRSPAPLPCPARHPSATAPTASERSAPCTYRDTSAVTLTQSVEERPYVFVVHRAAHGAALAAGLAEVLRTPTADPFSQDVVAVPAKGVERWLAQRLSHVLGSGADGSDGVCANVRFPSVTTLVDDALEPVTPADALAAWRPERLLWPLIDELDACPTDEPWCGPLVQHLGTGGADKGRRLRVSAKLARLYDAYAESRPEMLRAWALGDDTRGDGVPLEDDVRWQAELWRRLRARVQLPSAPELLDAACDRLRSGEVQLDLPERMSVFGTSRLSRARLQVLAALAEQREVHLWLHHASPALWDAVAARAAVRRRADDGSTEALRNPLLVSLSRDVRELQQLLHDRVPHAEVVHHEGPRCPDTLLGRLQADLAGDTVSTTPPPLAPDDRSVQVHSCHGRTRQVEVLREVVLGLLADDPTLEPRDVLVMCPDVETFAPLIAATFALGAEDAAAHPAARLRVRLADRALRQTNPLLSVLSLLLELGTARVTSSQVLDLAGAPAVRQRFGFDDDDLERLREWTVAAGVRWGFDTEHRRAWKLQDVGQGTWREGLDRLLLGAVTEGSADDVMPLDDVDSAAIDLAGRFCELVDRLDAALAEVRGQHTAGEWSRSLEHAVLSLAAPAPDAGWQEVQLRSALGDLREQAEGSRAALGLADVRALLGPLLAGRPTRASFRTGTLTVCTLVPMRSVPHRVVCLLGMDDGAFPRQSTRDGDDVLARDPWVGERDPGAEDRQLLLDAISAAGQHLVITCTGADRRTGAPVPPAVPLGELLDALDRTASVPGGRVRDAVTTRHPLQPFDPRNFEPAGLCADGPFSFDPISHDAAVALAGPRTPPPPLLSAPLPPREVEQVALVDLLRTLEHPARGFLRQRLDVAVTRTEDDPQESLPVELDGLHAWAVAERLLQDRLRGVELEECLRRELRRGEVPPGQLGQASLKNAADRAEQVLAASTLERALEPESYDVDVRLTGGTRLLGTVAGVRGTVLLSTTCASLSARHRLHAWVQLVALSVAQPGRGWTAVAVGRSGRKVKRSVQGPLQAEHAHAVLEQLVALHRSALTCPLPLPVKTSAEYAYARDRGLSVAVARTQAAKEWDDGRFPGECSEPEHVLLHGEDAPLTVLTNQPLLPDDTPEADESDRFGLLARRLWQPLLDHETTVLT